MKLLPISFIPGFLTLMAILSMPTVKAAPIWGQLARVEFRAADSNRNGGIGVMELARFRRDGGSISWMLRTATWLEFTRADMNGDESISLEEWQTYRLGRRVNLLGDQVQRFRSADWNADRRLNVHEVRLAFQPWLTPQQAKDTVRWLDSNADGLLTMGEFFRYVSLSPDAMRGMRRRDAEELLLAIGGTYHYTMFNGAVVDYFRPVHSLYWLQSDANVISACGYGIDLDSLVGKTDAEAVKVAELAGLTPASPMSPGIRPYDETVPIPDPAEGSISIKDAVGDQVDPSSAQAGSTLAVTPPMLPPVAGYAGPLNHGNFLPLRPYLVIYTLDGVVYQLQVTMGSPPYP